MSNNVAKKETDNIQKERTRSGKVYVPKTDIIEKKHEILVMADMPGADEKSIEVTLENKELIIQGFVNAEVPEGFDLTYSEYDIGDYYRAFTISDDIDRDKIEAKFEQGVLHLKLPKAEKAKAKKIAVTAS